MADTKTEPRTIQHALFSYATPGGGHAIAFRGQTVDLLPDDVARGEKFDAFTASPGDEPTPPENSTLASLAADASEADADAWVASGSVAEIMDAVNADPTIAPVVLAAEQRRSADARKTLLEALGRIVGAR